MFSKKFPFRRRKGDPSYNDHDEPKTDRLSVDVPAPLPTPPSTASSLASGLRRASSPGLSRGDSDPLGLRVVHRPEGDRTGDIIFVHGLGGGSQRTWSKDHNVDFFWPLRFLPLESGISETRISTFGYNSNFRAGSKRTRTSVLDFAKTLLCELKFAEDDFMGQQKGLGMGERPIVFVVHSMGGLVVKEAYMQGQNDPTYKSIINAVSAIIFLSTPHRGTNLAETLNRILQVSFVSNPMQFIAELAAGSQTLQKLNEQFRHVAPNLDIVSFYETRPTTVFTKTQIMVLEKDSSVLGYPGEISMPLEGDHHEVCKYESRVDPRYVTVRNVLKSLIRKGRPEGRCGNHADIAPHIPLENLLSVYDLPEREYNFFRDRWAQGTCSWILDDTIFSEWLNEAKSGPQILWLHGTAACGKSVLSSFVIDHLAQRGLPCQYFFVRFEDKKKRAISSILRSLAFQLAKASPAYAQQLRRLNTIGADIKGQDHRSIWHMLYKQSLLPLDIAEPIYWVLDGLDEADNPQALLNTLSEFCSSDIPIRILVVSRHTHDIATSFQKLREQQPRTRSLHIHGNEEDFRLYIDREIGLAGDNHYRKDITSQILQRAQGNFLWVHLAVHKINKCHTRVELVNALGDLPAGMEALYGRMASSVQTDPRSSDPTLGERILGWATYVRRPLTVDELNDALGDDELLEIHRTIGDLCGGFVVVDHEGRVALIHETAREYLSRKHNHNNQLSLGRKETHEKLFKRCIMRLMDKMLRARINQDRCPALLDYATSSWAFHLAHGSCTSQENLKILMQFFQSPAVLTWIQAAAKGKQLRALISASHRLGDVVDRLRWINDESSLLHCEAMELQTRWATDLVKLLGKFGNSLLQRPDSIYKLIPPFCPEDSAIYQQFGRKETRSLNVSGLTSTTWDDCLAKLPLTQGVMASCICASQDRIAVLANRKTMGYIFVYNAVTFEEECRIIHPERVFKICVGKGGTRLLSYGYKTTRVWDLSTGDCVKQTANPAGLPRPHSLIFSATSDVVLMGSADRCVRALKVEDDPSVWETRVQIKEDNPDGAIINDPTCAAISPDGEMIAFGYRRHPVSVWHISSGDPVGLCNMAPDGTGITNQENTMGEVTQLAWHPFNGEVFGLHREGLLFKWDPYDDDASDKVQARAHHLAISLDGSLVATGDASGTVKLYTTADFSLLYKLSSQSAVVGISFSTDTRRLYDTRGPFGNVWEPSALIRLAESSEFTDHSSDAWGDHDTLTKQSIQASHHSPGVGRVMVISGQPAGSLYSYVTRDGRVMLGEVGHGSVCELERSTGFGSITQVAWSHDGTIVALADLERKISVKRVLEADKASGQRWQCKHEFSVKLEAQRGFVGLFFQLGGRRLLAVSPTSLFCLDLDTLGVQVSTLPDEDSKMAWICHPTKPAYVLGFGVSKCYVYTWDTLTQVAVHHYHAPNEPTITTPSSSDSPSVGSGSFNHHQHQRTVGRLVSSTGSPDILLAILVTTSSGRPNKTYILLSVDDIGLETEDLDSSSDDAQGPDGLAYTMLPPEVTKRINEPLAILSRRRLLFLDVDRWICTWRVQTEPQARRGSEQGLKGIDNHYFLPGDWVTSNEVHLCTAILDGTLLCARNGEVAAVQCAKIRRT